MPVWAVGSAEEDPLRLSAREVHRPLPKANGSAVLTFPDPRAWVLSIRASALVFEDPASRALLERIQRVAPSDASILIRGETGTGKELVARHVHQLSHRKDGPFVAVNCAAFSEHLVEAELFGHERGAFTGATEAKAGWFETAKGGTLFLDEIGDLPLPLQVKLLRVLQEREVVRLGSRRPIPIDVRLIAATNVDLEEAVSAGRFREDLYFRIKVASLPLLPLRERPGDILPLVRHFLAQYGRRLGNDEVNLAPDATEVVHSYPWPGNIRELENAIHHALLICQGGVLRAGDLQLSSLQRPATKAPPAQEPSSLEVAVVALLERNLPNLHELIEETTVKTAFSYCDRNQVQTARILGISRNVVRAKLIRFGLI
ncbi:MAG: Fis family transcriptional regulator [Proteobacteria bacterium]|nr:MAG: Fis family transcriptional regulator [Pseudomonadota bacterium]